jgi:serine/threonine-protein kinase RsbW
MATATSVRLVLSSQVKLIDLIHAAAQTVAEAVGFEEDEALNIGLAVREAAINAIVHGNRQDPAKKVDVQIESNSTQLTIQIQDHGGGFDPDATPDPTSGDALLATSGRGLLMMRAFVDDVTFERNDAGMQVTLTKRIDAP